MTESTVGTDAGTRTLLRQSALLWAVLLGVLADWLLRAPGRPSLNLFLWAAAGTLAIATLLYRRGGTVDRESGWLIGGALALTGTLVLRDAEAPAVFSFLAAAALLILASGRAATRWVTRAYLTDFVFAIINVVFLCAIGPIGWGRRAAESVEGAPSLWNGRLRTVVRGIAMALPVLLAVNALLMSADPVFARIVSALFRVDIAKLLDHALVISFAAWVSAGLLRALLVRSEIANGFRVPRPEFAAAEVTLALWLLNALFIGFMVVQLRYLFGGANVVAATDGLSYAEYARHGFFELVDTAILVVPIILLADWGAATPTPRARTSLRAAMLVLVLLLVGVLGSAAYRMRLYQDAYGLTELRLLVSVIIVWLALVLGWLVFTVLRGQRDRFAFGASMAAVACLVMLTALNPDDLIARVNLDRAAAGKNYDPDYLVALSGDAVPAILARFDRLPEAERCRVGEKLNKRWGAPNPGGWRTWNLGDARARRLIAERGGSVAC